MVRRLLFTNKKEADDVLHMLQERSRELNLGIDYFSINDEDSVLITVEVDESYFDKDPGALEALEARGVSTSGQNRGMESAEEKTEERIKEKENQRDDTTNHHNFKKDTSTSESDVKIAIGAITVSAVLLLAYVAWTFIKGPSKVAPGESPLHIVETNTPVPTATPSPFDESEWYRELASDSDCDEIETFLKETSATSVKMDTTGCLVLRGKWQDFITGKELKQRFDETMVDNNKEAHTIFQVSNIIYPKEVWGSVGREWDRKKRLEFTSDKHNMVVTKNLSGQLSFDTFKENQGSKVYCTYIYKRVVLKEKYDIPLTSHEKTIQNTEREACNKHGIEIKYIKNPFVLAEWTAPSDARGCQPSDLFLIKTSKVPAKVRPKDCYVSSGKWEHYNYLEPDSIEHHFSQYDSRYDGGRPFYAAHVITPREAYEWGGMNWTKAQKTAFASDLENFYIRSKTRRVGDNYYPIGSDSIYEIRGLTLEYGDCRLLRSWLKIQQKYNFTGDEFNKALGKAVSFRDSRRAECWDYKVNFEGAEAPFNPKKWTVSTKKGECSLEDRFLEYSSKVPVKFAKDGCKVLKGEWNDFRYPSDKFDDRFNYNGGKPIFQVRYILDKELVHAAGGHLWPQEKIDRFLNDFDYMIVTYNRMAENKAFNYFRIMEEFEWKRDSPDFECRYAKKLMDLKKNYGLKIFKRDKNALAMCQER